MNRLTLFLIGFFVALSAFAGKVTEQEAMQKAQLFLQGKQFMQKKSLRRAPSTKKVSTEAYYIFNVEDKDGFVIVSGDDRLPDILAFSEKGNVDMKTLPCNMEWLLTCYENVIDSLDVYPMMQTQVLRHAAKRPSIEPLITTTWGQGAPYNKYCPEINGEKCPTGCVATAMAQIINYHKWPQSQTACVDAYITESSGINMPALEPTTFNWSNMTEDDIARLMLYCGQSTEMDYLLDGSGARIAPSEVLRNIFGYGKSTHSWLIKLFEADHLEQTVYDELSEDHPVYYTGYSDSEDVGHAFIVDGYMFNVTSSQTQGYDETTDTYKLYLSGKTDDVSDGTGEAKYLEAHAVLRLGINNSKETGYVRECLCDKGNLTARIQIASETMNIAAAASNASYFFADNDAPVDKNTFFIYQPNTFTLTISQICMEDGAPIVIEENTTSEVVTVNNGENFNTYLSGMPVKFMLGSISDGIKKDVDTNTGELIIANQSNFYASDIDATDNGYANGRSPLGRGVSGWYGLHQETAYRFDVPDAATILRNTDLWSDYVDLKSPITSYKSKSKILAFKFNSMFSISKSGYVVDGTTPFSYTARGGINPILIRSVVPQYESRNFKSRYVLSEKNRASGLDDYPHVIGSNYSGYTENGQKPQYNPIYSDREVIGNYFAAFTQNGGYSSSTAIDTSIKVIKIPNYTKVTPRDGNEKVIGVDEVRSIANYRYAFEKFNQYQPYLRSLFVDRRLDFNLVIFAPVIGDSFNLYPQRQEIDEKGNPVWIADDREKIWKSARISGWTYNDKEVHEVFGYTETSGNRFINTEKGGNTMDVVSANVTVSKDISIPDFLEKIFIENKTTGKMVKMAQAGEPPFAIIVPGDFDYPQEKVSITNAYGNFAGWAQNMTTNKDWYIYPEEGKVYPSLFK